MHLLEYFCRKTVKGLRMDRSLKRWIAMALSYIFVSVGLSFGELNTDYDKQLQQLKQELSKLRRSVTAKIENFATIPSSGATIRLQAAGADIKRHYNTNYSSLQKLKRTIKRHRPAPSTTKSKGPITINIRNNRSLANAYLATFTANRQQNIVFDCQNFWSSIDTQLLTLTSSAVQADEDRVILRHERTCNPKLQKQLMLHFLMLALPQSAFKNKGR